MAQVTIGGIPVFDAIISSDNCGMYKISLVDAPAVMSDFIAFDNIKKVLLYSVTNEEKRLVHGVVMRADFPIYRYDKEYGEYYVIYRADTIRQMAEKYLIESRQNNVNIMHKKDSDVEGVQMVQYYIKDSGRGISPEGFDEIADGSLFAEFHIINDEVWEAVKDGTFKGFSLEGIFDLEAATDKETIAEIVDSLDGKFSLLKKETMAKLKGLLARLAKALQEFGNVTTDKGVLAWDGDEDLVAGMEIFIEDADGNRSKPDDGDYKTADNKVIVVVDGKVSEIKDPDAEVDTGTSEQTKMQEVPTDKGTLHYDGEEGKNELKAGDKVYVFDENGESQPAPSGDYTTEDGKVIKVTDGVVDEIVDDNAVVATKNKSIASRIAENFAEAYDEKVRKIYDAIRALVGRDYFWVISAGDDFAIIQRELGEEDFVMRYEKYSIVWEGDIPKAGNPVEVKQAFVPMDVNVDSLFSKIEQLEEENAALRKQPLAKPAHTIEVEASAAVAKTGNKGLDRLSQIMATK